MPALATIDPPNGHAPPLPIVSKSAKAAALTAATHATAAVAAIKTGATDGAGVEARRTAGVQKKKQKARALCYTPPTLINDRKKDRQYFRRGLLGEGGFARCFEVTDFQGTRLAAKTVAKTSILSEKVKGKLLGEIKVHKSMDHPHIVRQRDCFEDDVNVYMILELCPNGTLMEMLKRRGTFTDPEVRLYGLQLLGATKYMHSRRVIHRDLKLGNLFLDEDMNLRVGDFGLAALLIDDDDRKKTICGTPNYIAPEVLYGAANGHSYEVDVWSIGVILYAMTVGKPPFQSKDVKQIYARIKVNEYSWPALDGGRQVDPNLRDLVTKLLAADPDSRPSIDDIAAHPFFNSGVMPKSIPLSALKQAPEWPALQPAALFRRHHLYVTERAGVGGGRVAGLRQGQRVEAIVERPEGDRCLPPSLSPRTGPQARMVSLEMQRAGGLGIAERLEQARLSAPAHRPPQTQMQMQMQAHASMPPPERATAASGMAGGARRHVAATAVDVQAQAQTVSSHAVTASAVAAASLAGAGAGVTSAPGRMAPPQRPVTRSSRYPRGLSEQAGAVAGSQRVTRSVSAAAAASRPSASPDPEPAESAPTATAAAGAGAGAAGSRTSSRVSRRSNDDALPSTRASATASPAPCGGFVAPRQVLQSLTTCLASSLSQPRASSTSSAAHQLSASAAAVVAAGASSHSFISRWVDYSHKYGLGYCLRSGATGVHFNDGSSIVLEPAGRYFSYVHDSAHGRAAAASSSAAAAAGVDASGRSGAEMERHLLDGANHRPDMAKKVLLLRHFRDYMHNNLSGGEAVPTNAAAAGAGGRGKRSALATTSTADDSGAADEPEPEPEVYLTKYRKLSGGILFVMSDGTVQCNFTDHSKLAVATTAASANTSGSGSATAAGECFARFIDINKRTTDATVALLARGAAGQEGRDKLKLLYAHLAE